jgi:tectonic-1/3
VPTHPPIRPPTHPPGKQEQAATCWRTLPTAVTAFAALCEDTVSLLSPLAYARTQFPANPAAAAMFNATVASVARLDPATGALSAAAAAAPVFVAAAGAAPAKCAGAVVRADFLMRYMMDAATGDAQLVSVSVDLTVSDITFSAAPAAPQAASVAWADAAAPAAALLPFSGAPGYLEGFPVLAGVKQASGAKAAVARLKGGLQLPAPGAGGACGGARGASVGFGYNGSAYCAGAATLAELQALCDPAADASAAARAAAGGVLLDAALAGTLVLGVWGSSDAANANEWVQVAVAGWPPAAPQWSAGERRCDGVVTGFDLKIVTGVAFSAGNPQRKIVHAQLCLTTGSWAHDARRAAAAGGAAQAFPLRFSVSFAALDQGAPAAALRPAPPLVMPLPPDLFYPFLRSSGD